MKRQNVRTLSLVVTTFTYLLIGAAVFDSLELSNDEKRMATLTEIKSDIQHKYNITDEDLDWIEQMVLDGRSHKAGPQWRFAGAFFFATVVIAPIGYGHSTPSTFLGKAFCMLYAGIGIPLGIVMFQSIGERLNKGAAVIITKLKKLAKCKDVEASEMNMMMATGCLSSIIMTGGAAMFSKFEGWSYFDAFYYCFITLTTIGFGDYVPLQQDQALSRQPGYVILTVVFILFGLAVVASSINILVLRFMTMQMEEMQREDTDLCAVSENVVTLLEDSDVETTGGQGGDQSGSYVKNQTFDQISVCSCTCYPRHVDVLSIYTCNNNQSKTIFRINADEGFSRPSSSGKQDDDQNGSEDGFFVIAKRASL